MTGTMTVADGTVSAVDVEVDLTTLDSDSDRRDGALRTRGLRSDRFPTATFALTEPAALPSGLSDGDRASVSATVDLTIHGVANEVTIDLEAELRGDRAVVVGSAPVALADHGVDPPTGFSVLSIADQGTFELQLFLTRSWPTRPLIGLIRPAVTRGGRRAPRRTSGGGRPIRSCGRPGP